MKPTFVRRATPEDVLSVAQRLRPADRDECLAATGGDPLLVLPLLVQQPGHNVWAAGMQHNNRAEILYGVDPDPEVERVGTVWMVSTPEIYDFPVEFVWRTRQLYDGFHRHYDLLHNRIDARNTRHLKWLGWMGFKRVRDLPSWGAQNLPFIEFASYRTCA